jgi:hypothetical protein
MDGEGRATFEPKPRPAIDAKLFLEVRKTIKLAQIKKYYSLFQLIKGILNHHIRLINL